MGEQPLVGGARSSRSKETDNAHHSRYRLSASLWFRLASGGPDRPVDAGSRPERPGPRPADRQPVGDAGDHRAGRAFGGRTTRFGTGERVTVRRSADLDRPWHGNAERGGRHFFVRSGSATALSLSLAVLVLAGAIVAASAAQAETILHLTESASVSVHPDELVTDLRAESIAPTAAQAQSQVNATMSAALARARSVAGLTVSTGSYSVWRQPTDQTNRTERWQASQSMTIKGRNSDSVLGLAGDLQKSGLAMSQLSWQLAPDTAQHARADAMTKAIKGLRGRIDAAASLLDMAFASYQSISLDGPRPMPMPRGPMPAPMRASAEALPPSAEAADIDVSATVDADVVLKSRQ
jgi:uncharacterized protein